MTTDPPFTPSAPQRALDELRQIRRLLHHRARLGQRGDGSDRRHRRLSGPRPNRAYRLAWHLAGGRERSLCPGTAGILHKDRTARLPLRSEPARRFFLGLGPPLLVGTLLTGVFWSHHLAELLPAAWLLLYGYGVATGGQRRSRSCR
ncbi:MAG: hypothetical protein FJY95_12775 [Candidatus Handelsmanbacteria bacterium]|nr:hypothetical protein [Candidatus Handelsmanbacteria bacterium]